MRIFMMRETKRPTYASRVLGVVSKGGSNKKMTQFPEASSTRFA